MRASILVCAALFAQSARGAPLEAEGQVGAAFSNLPGLTAFALGGRISTDPLSHLSLGVRGFLILGGGPDTTGATSQFRGWAALGEVRVHTGEWLRPVRIHLGAALGLGREIAAAHPESESNTFEATATGPTIAASLGARIQLNPIFIGIEAAPFFWAGRKTLAGSGFDNSNGAVGALFLVSVGYGP